MESYIGSYEPWPPRSSPVGVIQILSDKKKYLLVQYKTIKVRVNVQDEDRWILSPPMKSKDIRYPSWMDAESLYVVYRSTKTNLFIIEDTSRRKRWGLRRIGSSDLSYEDEQMARQLLKKQKRNPSRIIEKEEEEEEEEEENQEETETNVEEIQVETKENKPTGKSNKEKEEVKPKKKNLSKKDRESDISKTVDITSKSSTTSTTTAIAASVLVGGAAGVLLLTKNPISIWLRNRVPIINDVYEKSISPTSTVILPPSPPPPSFSTADGVVTMQDINNSVAVRRQLQTLTLEESIQNTQLNTFLQQIETLQSRQSILMYLSSNQELQDYLVDIMSIANSGSLPLTLDATLMSASITTNTAIVSGMTTVKDVNASVFSIAPSNMDPTSNRYSTMEQLLQVYQSAMFKEKVFIQGNMRLSKNVDISGHLRADCDVVLQPSAVVYTDHIFPTTSTLNIGTASNGLQSVSLASGTNLSKLCIGYRMDETRTTSRSIAIGNSMSKLYLVRNKTSVDNNLPVIRSQKITLNEGGPIGSYPGSGIAIHQNGLPFASMRVGINSLDFLYNDSLWSISQSLDRLDSPKFKSVTATSMELPNLIGTARITLNNASLTGDITSDGSSNTRVVKVGSLTRSNILTVMDTPVLIANTKNSIVQRGLDKVMNVHIEGNITGNLLQGTVANAKTAPTATETEDFSQSVNGDVTGTFNNLKVEKIGNISSSNLFSIYNSIPSLSLLKRDENGSLSTTNVSTASIRQSLPILEETNPSNTMTVPELSVQATGISLTRTFVPSKDVLETGSYSLINETHVDPFDSAKFFSMSLDGSWLFIVTNNHILKAYHIPSKSIYATFTLTMEYIHMKVEPQGRKWNLFLYTSNASCSIYSFIVSRRDFSPYIDVATTVFPLLPLYVDQPLVFMNSSSTSIVSKNGMMIHPDVPSIFSITTSMILDVAVNKSLKLVAVIRVFSSTELLLSLYQTDLYYNLTAISEKKILATTPNIARLKWHPKGNRIAIVMETSILEFSLSDTFTIMMESTFTTENQEIIKDGCWSPQGRYFLYAGVNNSTNTILFGHIDPFIMNNNSKQMISVSSTQDIVSLSVDSYGQVFIGGNKSPIYRVQLDVSVLGSPIFSLGSIENEWFMERKGTLSNGTLFSIRINPSTFPSIHLLHIRGFAKTMMNESIHNFAFDYEASLNFTSSTTSEFHTIHSAIYELDDPNRMVMNQPILSFTSGILLFKFPSGSFAVGTMGDGYGASFSIQSNGSSSLLFSLV